MANQMAAIMRDMQGVSERSGRPVTMSSKTCGEIAQRLERLDRIEAVASCKTVDSFLAQSDEQKRMWFALALDESDRRKAAEDALREYVNLYGGRTLADRPVNATEVSGPASTSDRGGVE